MSGWPQSWGNHSKIRKWMGLPSNYVFNNSPKTQWTRSWGGKLENATNLHYSCSFKYDASLTRVVLPEGKFSERYNQQKKKCFVFPNLSVQPVYFSMTHTLQLCTVTRSDSPPFVNSVLLIFPSKGYGSWFLCEELWAHFCLIGLSQGHPHMYFDIKRFSRR